MDIPVGQIGRFRDDPNERVCCPRCQVRELPVGHVGALSRPRRGWSRPRNHQSGSRPSFRSMRHQEEPPVTTATSKHDHEWERGRHMTDAFYVDGRILHCAICGTPKPREVRDDRT